MSDLLDYRLPSTPGIRPTADFESAMGLSPMLGQLMELRGKSQNLRANDLQYDMTSYGFERKKRNDAEFDAFTDQMVKARDDSGGDPQAMRDAAMNAARSMPWNTQAQNAVQNLFKVDQTANAFRKEALESRNMDMLEQNEDMRREAEVITARTGLLQARKLEKEAMEWQGMDEAETSKRAGALVDSVFDGDPETAVNMSQTIGWLNDPSINRPDIAKKIGELGLVIPSRSNIKAVKASDYEAKDRFDAYLAKNGIDTKNYGKNPESSALVDAKIADMIASMEKSKRGSSAAVAASYAKWKNIRDDDANYDSMISGFKDVLKNYPKSGSPADMAEYNRKINGMLTVAGQMRKQHSDAAALHASRIEDRERMLDLQKKQIDLINAEQKGPLDLDKVKLAERIVDLREKGMKDDMIDETIRLALMTDEKKRRTPEDLRLVLDEVYVLAKSLREKNSDEGVVRPYKR